MDIKQINSSQNFDGRLHVIGEISKTQKYLFNMSRAHIESMVKDKPYDIYVRQSKSKKTIQLSADKHFSKNSWVYFVRKNKQNFGEMAKLLIANMDAKIKKENEIICNTMAQNYAKNKFQLMNLFY